MSSGGANASGPLALSPDGGSLWVVNPDADSVTRIDLVTLVADAPIPVGREPWAIAAPADDLVLVANRADGTVSFVEGGRVTDTLLLGPEPGGLALSRSRRLAYVTLSSSDELVVIDVAQRQAVERVAVGRTPWAVAIAAGEGGGDVVVVSHRLARSLSVDGGGSDDGREGWLTLIEDGALRELTIAPYAFGFANALEALAVAGEHVLVAHLLNSPAPPRAPFRTLSGGLTTVSLRSGGEVAERRLHLNDDTFSTPTNFPRSLAVTPDGVRAYLALAGTDAVMGIDLSAPASPRLLGFWPVGTNPRGIVLNGDGSRAYVMNYLSRDVSVLDLSDRVRRPEIARIAVVTETLPAELVRGKILFHNANDPRLSSLGWMSCASCHLDGGGDGTSWGTPEGVRQTMALWSLEGTAPFHASGTRDEIQDFEFDIERFMGGVGLAPGAASPLLGAPNGGRSADLDALARFVLTGFRVPAAAPVEDAAAFAAGRALFGELGCTACHGGPAWTRSHLPGEVGTLAPHGEQEVLAVLHDVGTHEPASDLLGANGFDAPTLLGLHATAPYLHSGRAATLDEVLLNPKHVGRELTPGEVSHLSYFLRHLDGGVEPFE